MATINGEFVQATNRWVEKLTPTLKQKTIQSAINTINEIGFSPLEEKIPLAIRFAWIEINRHEQTFPTVITSVWKKMNKRSKELALPTVSQWVLEDLLSNKHRWGKSSEILKEIFDKEWKNTSIKILYYFFKYFVSINDRDYILKLHAHFKSTEWLCSCELNDSQIEEMLSLVTPSEKSITTFVMGRDEISASLMKKLVIKSFSDPLLEPFVLSCSSDEVIPLKALRRVADLDNCIEEALKLDDVTDHERITLIKILLLGGHQLSIFPIKDILNKKNALEILDLFSFSQEELKGPFSLLKPEDFWELAQRYIDKKISRRDWHQLLRKLSTKSIANLLKPFADSENPQMWQEAIALIYKNPTILNYEACVEPLATILKKIPNKEEIKRLHHLATEFIQS